MKTLAFISLLVLSYSCSACRFDTADSLDVRNAVKARGGYPISEQQCLLLNKNGLALSVAGNASVLRGVSIGWAKITLIDLKTHVTSTIWQGGTNVNIADASQDTADGLLYEAARSAIAAFDFQASVNEINEYRGKAKVSR